MSRKSDAIYEVPPPGYRGGGAGDSVPAVVMGAAGLVLALLIVLLAAGLMDARTPNPERVPTRQARIGSAVLSVPDHVVGPQERRMFPFEPGLDQALARVMRDLRGRSYSGLWDGGHPALRRDMRRDDFVAYLRGIESQLGRFQSVGIVDAALVDPQNDLLDRRGIVVYDARFANGRASMRVVMGDREGRWGLMSIDIEPKG